MEGVEGGFCPGERYGKSRLVKKKVVNMQEQPNKKNTGKEFYISSSVLCRKWSQLLISNCTTFSMRAHGFIYFAEVKPGSHVGLLILSLKYSLINAFL